MCLGKQPRLKRPTAFLEGALEVKRSEHTIFRRSQRQVHERNRNFHRRSLRQCAAMCAVGPNFVRIAMVWTVLHARNGRQDVAQGSCCRALGRSLLTANQYASNGGI